MNSKNSKNNKSRNLLFLWKLNARALYICLNLIPNRLILKMSKMVPATTLLVMMLDGTVEEMFELGGHSFKIIK